MAQSADFSELNRNKQLFERYLSSRDTNILKQLASRAVEKDYGANASGYLEQLASKMSGHETEVKNIIFPSLLSAISSTNLPNPRAAILALSEFVDLYPTTVQSLTSVLPQFYTYIDEHRFGESSKALIRIITKPSKLDPNTIKLLRKLLQTSDDKVTLRNSPLSSVRVEAIDAIGMHLQANPELTVEIESCLDDKNPFVAAAAMFVLVKNGFVSDRLCTRIAHFLETEGDPQYLLLEHLDELKSIPKCMFSSLNRLNDSNNREISALAESLVKKIDSK